MFGIPSMLAGFGGGSPKPYTPAGNGMNSGPATPTQMPVDAPAERMPNPDGSPQATGPSYDGSGISAGHKGFPKLPSDIGITGGGIAGGLPGGGMGSLGGILGGFLGGGAIARPQVQDQWNRSPSDPNWQGMRQNPDRPNMVGEPGQQNHVMPPQSQGAPPPFMGGAMPPGLAGKSPLLQQLMSRFAQPKLPMNGSQGFSKMFGR